MASPPLDAIRTRAGGACEYCHLPEALYPGLFVIEHVIARQHGGGDDLSNLAYASDRCNLHKGRTSPAWTRTRAS
jgi:5-methylcytosine-specific restriction endonuclease McrA